MNRRCGLVWRKLRLTTALGVLLVGVLTPASTTTAAEPKLKLGRGVPSGPATFSGGIRAVPEDTFQSGGGSPFWIVAADFNGDGIPDLAVTNSASNTVSVLLGQGNGQFAAAVDYDAGSSPTGLIASDLRGTGKPDLVVANSTGSGGRFALYSLSVLLNNGDGTFGQRSSIDLGVGTAWLAAGDLRHSGKPDLVASNFYGGGVFVLLNNGDGTFGAPVQYGSDGTQFASEPFNVALADMSGDGKLDVVLVNTGAGTVGVMLGNGDGSFKTPTTTPVGPNPLGLAIADFNGDGNLDVATTTDVGGGGLAATLKVLYGDGNGGFGSTSTLWTGRTTDLAGFGTTDQTYALASGDFNGDGTPDLVMPITTTDPFNNITASLLSFINLGGGSFSPVVTYNTTRKDVTSIAVGDYNADGLSDMALANHFENTIDTVLTFTPAPVPQFVPMMAKRPAPVYVVGAPGKVVNLTGRFGKTKPMVLFGSTPVSQPCLTPSSTGCVVAYSAGNITVRAPSGLTGKQVVTAKLALGRVLLPRVTTFDYSPAITNISPLTGRAGSVVHISGGNFGTAAASVTFGNSAPVTQPCGTLMQNCIVRQTNTSIAVRSPLGLLGPQPVGVTIGTQQADVLTSKATVSFTI